MKNLKSTNLKKRIWKHRYAAAAFFLPALLLAIAFAATGIYPFGPNQITIIDMYHQYVPFLSELQYKLQHGGSMLYSWHGAGGFSFLTLMAYYGGSPLNLLLVLFPPGLIVEGVTLVLIFKVGFAGMFMYLYLRRSFPRTARMPLASRAADNWAGVAFGTMYALSAYLLGYFWCIMWIDVMALLPLCILGLRRLVDEGKPVMYCIGLALIILCNYYIAIMMCIFIVLYYLVIYFEKAREGGFKAFVGKTVHVAICSVIGAAMACILFLPTWRSMKNAYYFADAWPEEWTFYHEPIEILNQLLPNAHLCIREGLPNLYCGLFAVIMLVIYFVARTIPFREKVAHGAFLLLMFFSLNVNKFDFIWHGLHFPNELPFRYSFVISFVLLGMAYRAYLRLGQIRRKTLMATLAGILAYYLIASKILVDAVDDQKTFFYLGLGFLLLYGLILILQRQRFLGPTSFSGLLVLIVAAEMLCSATIAFDLAGNVDREEYLSDRQSVEKMVAQTRDEFCRVERSDGGQMNAPALYHYNGISQFASCLNANATELMESIGMDGEPGNNRYNYVFTTPVVNAMLNIKYIISEEGDLGDRRFKLKDEDETSGLYENSQPLSIGYMVDNSIKTWSTLETDPFRVQDDYVNAATDGKVTSVFEEIDCEAVDPGEMTVEEVGDGIYDSSGGEGIAGVVTLTYKAPEAGDYYLFIEADSAETIQMYRADGTFKDIREDCGSALFVGPLGAGEEFTVDVNYESDGQGRITSHVCRLDEKAWNMTYDIISRHMMEVEDFGDTYIKGKIHAARDGVFMTSVLYEKGWKLYVDGERREIEDPVGGDFIATDLTAGDHEIELRYVPDGFVPGVVLTILGILALIALQLRQRLTSRLKRSGISSRGMRL